MFEPASIASISRDAPAWMAALGGRAGFTPDNRYDLSASQQAVDPEHATDARHSKIAEAFEDGRLQGLADAGQLAGKETAERRKLGSSLRRMDEEMTQALGGHLSEAIVALCEATLAPLALDRDLLATRCQKAARLLGDTHNDSVLRLNPDDIAALDGEFLQSWNISPDPDLPQGALRIESAGGGISDGPDQWRAALRETLGLVGS